MNRSQRVLLVLLGLVISVTIGWRSLAWRAAAADFDRAFSEHADVAAKSARAAALRALAPVSGFGSRPTEDVIQLANRVLEAATLPPARLRSVQSEMDRAIQDDREGRRLTMARLSLEPLTVPELGAFLSAWRNRQQVWSVTRIELSALTPTRDGPVARGQGQYRASITVSASYIDNATGTTLKSASPSSNSSTGAYP